VINGGKVLGLIPARGGSKGVPGKNIRPVRGKPLIGWTIDAALGCRYLDRVIVSTDAPEIAEVALRCGAQVPFMRPAALAGDDTPGIAPVLHAMEMLPDYEWVVLLQPTSPLRAIEDIDGCLDTCLHMRAPACVSVTEPAQSPYLMFALTSDATLEPLLGWNYTSTRRQDLPPAYALNGAVYAARTDWLRRTRTFVTAETVAFVMPPERSLDIDSEIDFKILETQLGDRKA
jgi:CMP-N,N'-diacetyllegionaminic acid synthase